MSRSLGRLVSDEQNEVLGPTPPDPSRTGRLEVPAGRRRPRRPLRRRPARRLRCCGRRRSTVLGGRVRRRRRPAVARIDADVVEGVSRYGAADLLELRRRTSPVLENAESDGVELAGDGRPRPCRGTAKVADPPRCPIWQTWRPRASPWASRLRPATTSWCWMVRQRRPALQRRRTTPWPARRRAGPPSHWRHRPAGAPGMPMHPVPALGNPSSAVMPDDTPCPRREAQGTGAAPSTGPAGPRDPGRRPDPARRPRGVATFWTDFLWFDLLDLSAVWRRLLPARLTLGVAVGRWCSSSSSFREPAGGGTPGSPVPAGGRSRGRGRRPLPASWPTADKVS